MTRLDNWLVTVVFARLVRTLRFVLGCSHNFLVTTSWRVYWAGMVCMIIRSIQIHGWNCFTGAGLGFLAACFVYPLSVEIDEEIANRHQMPIHSPYRSFWIYSLIRKIAIPLTVLQFLGGWPRGLLDLGIVVALYISACDIYPDSGPSLTKWLGAHFRKAPLVANPAAAFGGACRS